jgi:beta-glucosidase
VKGFAILAYLAASAAAQTHDIDALLRRMTPEEKIALLHGARDPENLGEAGYWPGLPRLGIPPLRLADGPGGVNVNADATAMPAPVGLAATFSPAAAQLYGEVMGRDARALELDILLAPHVNMVRDPLFRRNHTTLGEDPLLTARLAAAEIAGIQSQGAMAQVKHLAGYNGADNVAIDERTLREIYLPAFEAAVDAGAASVMCAYNRINGPWACENPEIQNGILRGEWGFTGFVTSDWGAAHSPAALAAGMDLEMPGREIAGRPGGPYLVAPLPPAAVDAALGRILRQMDRFHLLDAKPPARPAIDIEADAKAVRDIATQSAVLLRNERGLLPLTEADLASLAVIGPTGGQLATGWLGERAAGFPERLVSPLDALRRLAPGARIRYAVGGDLTGVPIPASALSDGGKAELALAPLADYAWTGTLTVAESGDYAFAVQAGAEGTGSIVIDGKAVARTGGFGFAGGGAAVKKWSSIVPTTDGRDNPRGTVKLAAGEHKIELAASSMGTGPFAIRFAWMTPALQRTNLAAAVALAKAVRTPVVFAWSGIGDTLALPEDQDEMIIEMAAANPRTIVVLNTGGPVAMPWKNDVRAILEMWYPGQEGGWATADLLLGRANPSGKLPVTFPARIEDTPAHAAKSDGAVTAYSEGIAVGYRWYDRQNIEPLFCFGSGLSYTQFEYSNLALTRTADGIEIAVNVRNTGSRKGAEVAQIYLGPPPNPPVPMVPEQLAAFERVDLNPGQSKRITLGLGKRALSYWSVAEHAWAVAGGQRTIYIGSSSRDIRLRGSFR